MNSPLSDHLDHVRAVFPHLTVQRIERRNGQFNDILIINDELVFRFPRSVAAAEMLGREITILNALRGTLPLPTPDPVHSHVDPANRQITFMGYSLLPGVPLQPELLADIDDPSTLDSIATQLAVFLRALHAVPLESLPMSLPVAEDLAGWSALFADFREQLYPFMRPDARTAVTRSMEKYLSDPSHFAFTPVLRHGDFGIGNILFDPATHQVTGVIDFGSAGPGDPAQDLGALLASFGQSFVDRLFRAYPEMHSMLSRATFFTTTYALQQALDALRDGDDDMFNDGIARYI